MAKKTPAPCPITGNALPKQKKYPNLQKLNRDQASERLRKWRESMTPEELSENLRQSQLRRKPKIEVGAATVAQIKRLIAKVYEQHQEEWAMAYFTAHAAVLQKAALCGDPQAFRTGADALIGKLTEKTEVTQAITATVDQLNGVDDDQLTIILGDVLRAKPQTNDESDDQSK